MSLSFSSGGNRFQTAGAATQKLWFPKQTVQVRGTVRSPLSADRSRARPATEPTGQQTSSKYAGHLSWRQSNAISAILKSMRWVWQTVQRVNGYCEQECYHCHNAHQWILWRFIRHSKTDHNKTSTLAAADKQLIILTYIPFQIKVCFWCLFVLMHTFCMIITWRSVWVLRVGVGGWKLLNCVPRGTLPIHLFGHFCCRTCCSATMHAITNWWTNRRTDDSM